jgi:recombination protein RecR
MYEGIIQDLIDELGRLPGVGPKSAQRIAFHIIASDRVDVTRLAEVLKTVKERVKFCTTCGNISEEDLCRICRDPRRDKKYICVVEESYDVLAIENTGQFMGLYHVLGGIISPLSGISPGDLTIESLVARVASGKVSEVILGLSPTMEGDTTAFYLTKKLKEFPVKLSTIARGIPIGGDLEYTDEITLGRSIVGRIVYE